MDDFSTGGWAKSDCWGVFSCDQALLAAQDSGALPELRRVLALLQKGDAEAKGYIPEAASGLNAEYWPCVSV